MSSLACLARASRRLQDQVAQPQVFDLVFDVGSLPVPRRRPPGGRRNCDGSDRIFRFTRKRRAGGVRIQRGGVRPRAPSDETQRTRSNGLRGTTTAFSRTPRTLAHETPQGSVAQVHLSVTCSGYCASRRVCPCRMPPVRRGCLLSLRTQDLLFCASSSPIASCKFSPVFAETALT